MIVTPNQDDIFRVVGDFVINVTGIETVQGQVNRTPEPKTPDFSVMWPIMRNRLETNTDEAVDTLFIASIAGTTLTVTDLSFGEIQVSDTIFGENIAPNTTVTDLGTGTGGVGTYVVNNTQNVSSEQMACGVTNVIQPTEVVIQLDVHGPAASDNAQVVSTMFRDPYGVEFISGENENMSPLFASDPRMVPFTNAEQQVEIRYVVELHLQVNQAIVVPQQFAGAVEVDVINVEEAYQ